MHISVRAGRRFHVFLRMKTPKDPILSGELRP